MMATDLIEELRRVVLEFGDCKVKIVDELEPDWRYPVTGVEFEQGSQELVLSADR
jgi:hypothetical protein